MGGFLFRCGICQHPQLAFAFFLFIQLSSPADLRADDAEMQRIREAHQKWMASVVSLHLTCEIKYDPFSEADREAGTRGQQVTQTLEWAWTDMGRFRHQYVFIRDGAMESRSLFLDDGERSFKVEYPNGNSTENQPKRVAIGPSRGGSEAIIEPLYGLWYSRRNEWLGQLLAAGLATHEGYETVDGVMCPKLAVERAPNLFVTVVLDPRHGYLPVDVQPGSKIFHLQIKKFREIRPEVWMPDAGEFLTQVDGKPYDKKTWRIESLELNRDLPVSLFRPSIPKGTSVIDSLKGESYRQGMPRRRPSARQVSQEAIENLSGGTEGAADVSAVPRPFFWRRWGATVLLMISVVLICTAIWLWLRRTNIHTIMEK